MTITILKLAPGQKIPRPMNRASNQNELIEVLAHYIAGNTGPETGRWRRAKEAGERAANDPAAAAHIYSMNVKNIDTETPVAELGKMKFYAFTEE